MAYAILPALMLCMHRFFNKINNIQILLHNIRISLHVGNTHPIIVSAINNKVLLLLILRKYLNLYLVQSVIIDPILLMAFRIFLLYFCRYVSAVYLTFIHIQIRRHLIYHRFLICSIHSLVIQK